VALDGGTWKAQFLLDAKDAFDTYTKLRQEHLSTVSALGAGAGALTSVGTAFTAVGVGLAAGLVQAAFAAGEFERKLDYFTAVAGPGAADQYDKVRQEALRLGNDTIYSADQIADSFIELAKSGVGVEELLAGIGEAVSNLGAAADMPLEDAAKGLTTVLNTFGLAAEDAVGVVDRLAGAANSSSIDVNDLILTLTYAGASAKVAGIEFEDVNAAIALLGERGIRGSKAGTGLRQMFQKLLAPTNKGTKALKALGIVTEDGANALLDYDGKLKPIPQLLDTLNGATAGLTTSEKLDVLGKIFPITSLPTILNLLDGGSEAMARLNAEIGKTTAMDIAMARLDNLSGDVEILRGNLETLNINVGAVQQGFMRWVTQGLVAVTQWLNTLEPSVLSLIVGIVGTTAAILIAVGAMGLLAGAFLNMAQLVLVLGPALQTLAKVFPVLALAVGRLKAVLLFPATPIVAVFLAIAGALAFFFTQTEQGQAVWAQLMVLFQQAMVAIQPLLGVLTELAGTALAWVMQALTALVPVLNTVGQFFMTVLAPYIAIVSALLGNLATAFSGVGTSATGLQGLAEIGTQIFTGIIAAIPMVINALVQLITTLLTALVGMLPSLVSAAITLFQGLIQGIIQILPTLITAVVQLITQVLTALIGMLPMLIQAALTLFTGLVQGLATAIPLILQAVVQMLTTIVTALIAAIPVLLEAAIQIFTTLVEALPVIIPQLITAIVELIPQIIEALINMIPVLLEGAIQLFMSLIDAVIEIIPMLITTVIELIPVIISSLISMIPVLINGAIQLFMAIVQAVPKIIGQLIPAIINLIPTIIQTVISLIPQLVNAAVQLFMGIVQAIPKVVPKIVSQLVSMGRDLIEGLARGIANAGNAVMNAIGNVVNGAVDWAKGLLGIKSPSRVFMGIGKFTIQGMINGMDQMKPQLERQMSMVADSLDSFYDQVYAAREFDTMMNLQTEMGINSSNNGLAAEMAALNAQLAEIAEKDTVNIEKLEVTKEEGENLDESLPKAIRKSAYLVG
jgi:TP901 family phage tail tape measure protein